MDQPNFYCYKDKLQRDKVAIELFIFGYTTLKHSYIIKNLSKLKELIDLKSSNKIPDDVFREQMNPFLFENLMDAIRICIFFENYMKGVLISKNYIIHKIKHTGLVANLGKLQKKRPISINELSTAENFILYEAEAKLHHNNLLLETITMSTMLNNSNYTSLIGLPPSILKMAIEINQKRNQLHFLNNWAMSIGNSTLTELSELINFADNLINSMKKPI